MMTEIEMIKSMERLIQLLNEAGFDTSSSVHFFDVGEWLICFEGLENIINDNSVREKDILNIFSNLKLYFSTD